MSGCGDVARASQQVERHDDEGNCERQQRDALRHPARDGRRRRHDVVETHERRHGTQRPEHARQRVTGLALAREPIAIPS